jgi:hypothetical protein
MQIVSFKTMFSEYSRTYTSIAAVKSASKFSAFLVVAILSSFNTVEPLITDTLINGHLQ